MASRQTKHDNKRRTAKPRRLLLWPVLLILLIGVVGLGIYSGNRILKKWGIEDHFFTQPKVVASYQEKIKLDKEWAHDITGDAKDVSIAVYDHKTGTTATYYVGKKSDYYTDSTIKVSVLATLLDQLRAEESPLSEYQQELATAMIENSDNDSTTTLIAQEGLDNIDAFWQKLGMNQSQTDASAWGLTTTSPEDQLKLLNEIFYQGQFLSADSRAYIEELMGNVEPDQNWGISAGVPDDAEVELKNGWLPDGEKWIVNSIGHVKTKKLIIQLQYILMVPQLKRKVSSKPIN